MPTGHVIFGRQSALWAVPFDLDRLETTDREAQVLQGLDVGSGFITWTVSDAGTLVYVPRTESESVPVWVDRNSGEVTPLLSEWGAYETPSLSPDDTRLAVTVGSERGLDVWVYDLERGTSTRVTDNGFSANPIWSVDGERIIFLSTAPDSLGLYRRSADASSEIETLLATEYPAFPNSQTPDGELSFVELHQTTGLDIWTLTSDGQRVPYLVTRSYEGDHDSSPNGQWIAYNSNESGDFEVYVQEYPEPGAKHTISIGGGVQPKWSPDGSELFYRTIGGNQMMVAGVTTTPTFQAMAPRILFEGQYEQALSGATNYDVSSDGQRFVMIMAGGEAGQQRRQLIVVQNWTEELKRLVPTP